MHSNLSHRLRRASPLQFDTPFPNSWGMSARHTYRALSINSQLSTINCLSSPGCRAASPGLPHLSSPRFALSGWHARAACPALLEAAGGATRGASPLVIQACRLDVIRAARDHQLAIRVFLNMSGKGSVAQNRILTCKSAATGPKPQKLWRGHPCKPRSCPIWAGVDGSRRNPATGESIRVRALCCHWFAE